MTRIIFAIHSTLAWLRMRLQWGNSQLFKSRINVCGIAARLRTKKVFSMIWDRVYAHISSVDFICKGGGSKLMTNWTNKTGKMAGTPLSCTRTCCYSIFKLFLCEGQETAFCPINHPADREYIFGYSSLYMQSREKYTFLCMIISQNFFLFQQKCPSKEFWNEIGKMCAVSNSEFCTIHPRSRSGGSWDKMTQQRSGHRYIFLRKPEVASTYMTMGIFRQKPIRSGRKIQKFRFFEKYGKEGKRWCHIVFQNRNDSPGIVNQPRTRIS